MLHFFTTSAVYFRTPLIGFTRLTIALSWQKVKKMIGGRPEKAKGGNQDGSGCPSAKNTFSKQPKIKTAASLLGTQSNKQKFYAKPSIEGDPASWSSSRFLKRECFLAIQDSVALVFFKAHRNSIVVTETKLLKLRCIKPTKQPVSNCPNV